MVTLDQIMVKPRSADYHRLMLLRRAGDSSMRWKCFYCGGQNCHDQWQCPHCAALRREDRFISIPGWEYGYGIPDAPYFFKGGTSLPSSHDYFSPGGVSTRGPDTYYY